MNLKSRESEVVVINPLLTNAIAIGSALRYIPLDQGQKLAPQLDYAPLPTKDLLPKIEAKLRTLKAGGQQLIKK